MVGIILEAPINCIGFGLAVVVFTIVRNNEDYYIATQLDLDKTEYTGFLNNMNYHWEGPKSYLNNLDTERPTYAHPFVTT